MTVQDAVKAAMKAKKITQGQMAEKLGTGQSNLSMQLKSGVGMRLENLLRMVNACGYDVALIDRENASNVLVIGDHDSVQVAVDKSFDDKVREIVKEELAKR